MTYDLVLCECACGNRVAYPIPDDLDVEGFVCDACFLRYRFQPGGEPTRVELTDENGATYPLSFRVFSLRRDDQELAEEIVSSWFTRSPMEPPPPRRRVTEASG